MEQNELYSEIVSGQHFVMTADGFYEMTYNARPIGRQHEALNSIHDSVKIDAGVIGEVAGCPTALTIGAGGNMHITTTKLKKLRLNTSYDVIEREIDGSPNKWLSPTFCNTRESNSENLCLEWIVPDNIQLFISFFMRKEGPTYRPENAYLYAMYKLDDGIVAKTTHVIPVSNLYEDSRICFGEEFASGKTALSTCQKNIDLFYATPWNSDIRSGNHGNSTNFFRYNVDSNEQMQMIGDPVDNSRTFSHSTINEINHIQLTNL